MWVRERDLPSLLSPFWRSRLFLVLQEKFDHVTRSAKPTQASDLVLPDFRMTTSGRFGLGRFGRSAKTSGRLGTLGTVDTEISLWIFYRLVLLAYWYGDR